jgi:regulation of enolase protein 1 (concanavalin A-like superfamily)
MQLQYLSVSSPPNPSPVPLSFPDSTSSTSATFTSNDFNEADISTLNLYPASNSSSIVLPDSEYPPQFLHALFPSITWREPPNKNYFTTILLGPNFPISSFHRVRVTVSADWVGEGDQGGLLLYMPMNTSTTKARQRWFKAGIQFVDGKACESVVATDEWSDWSCGPVRDNVDTGFGGGAMITLEIERDREGTGNRWRSGVSVYIIEGETRRKIRQCTWFFEGMDESKRMLAAMYANKPTQDERKELLVRFDDFKVTKR